ncbi:MAG: ATPase [Anaerolineae bacterium]
MLDRSWHLPFSSKTVIDGDEYLHLIDQIRISVPQEINEARRVLQEKEQILTRAREEAANIIALAKEQRERMVEDHDIRRLAEAEREELLEQARQEAERIAAEADAYALEVLRDLERQLTSFQKIVQNGIVVLEGRQAGQKDSQALPS